jgi:hypothetical protein
VQHGGFAGVDRDFVLGARIFSVTRLRYEPAFAMRVLFPGSMSSQRQARSKSSPASFLPVTRSMPWKLQAQPIRPLRML